MKGHVYVTVHDLPNRDLSVGIFRALEGAKGKALEIAKRTAKSLGMKFDPKKCSWEYGSLNWRLVGDEFCEGLVIARMKVK